MGKSSIQYKQKLSAVFASFAVLIMGTISLLESMSIDYYSVLSTLIKVVPASIIMGILGWVMGMILDQPRRRRRTGHNHLFVNEIMKNDLSEEAVKPDIVAAAQE